MNWLAYALASAVLGVGYSLVSRKLAVNSDNPRALSIVFNASSALLALLLLLVEDFWFHSVPTVGWILFLVAAILYAVFESTHFYGRKYVDASTSSILFRLNTVISVLLSFIFLHESVTVNKLLATLLIVAGTYIVSVKNFNIKFQKGFVFILIATIALGLVRPIDKSASVYFAPALYTFMTYAGPLVFMSLFPNRIRLVDLQKEITTGKWRIFLLSAINVFEYYFMLKAYSLADASLVIPIVSLSTVLTVICGIIFLHERDHILRKLIAGLLAFCGLLLIR